MLAEYLPGVPSLAAFIDESLSQVGAYRFDDPAGDVGIETIVMTNADGVVLQMPLSYRSAPVAGAGASLLGTMEHSVLGDRWIYNACTEPIYVAVLASTMLAGGAGAREMFDNPDGFDGPDEREPSVVVQGSGDGSTAAPVVTDVTVESVGTDSHLTGGGVTIVLPHILSAGHAPEGAAHLTGTWASIGEPIVLASLL